MPQSLGCPAGPAVLGTAPSATIGTDHAAVDATLGDDGIAVGYVPQHVVLADGADTLIAAASETHGRLPEDITNGKSHVLLVGGSSPNHAVVVTRTHGRPPEQGNTQMPDLCIDRCPVKEDSISAYFDCQGRQYQVILRCIPSNAKEDSIRSYFEYLGPVSDVS